HSWEFEALDNDTIYISVGPSTSLDVALELVDPDGTTIEVTNDFSSGQGESIIEMNLVDSGVYQVEIRAVSGTSGNYSIVLTNLDSEAFLLFRDHLTYGGLGTGNLSTNTDHLWNFDAAAGDMVTVRVDPANNDDLVLFLVAPDSTELIFVDEGDLGEAEQIIDFVITEAGVYSIRVGELEFQPASYTVTLEGP
ncbi:MAG TPA: PPC domain-containing protein, partial [candidate division Zixibacteria bacterium]|nr:PPC domain-containing protein [candidate division Zixibacteria bacterium]